MRINEPAGQPDEGIWIPESARRQAPPTPAAEPAAAEPQEDDDATVEAAPPEADYHEKYLRALADLDNVRKRLQEQQRVAVERANERFVLDLLPVLDALQRGLEAAGQDASVESLQQGMDLVGTKLRSALASHGVELIPCEAGEEFDPEKHEAMMRVPASDDLAEGHVAAVLEPGYTLAGRVIRAVKVAVAAAPLDEQA